MLNLPTFLLLGVTCVTKGLSIFFQLSKMEMALQNGMETVHCFIKSQKNFQKNYLANFMTRHEFLEVHLLELTIVIIMLVHEKSDYFFVRFIFFFGFSFQ